MEVFKYLGHLLVQEDDDNIQVITISCRKPELPRLVSGFPRAVGAVLRLQDVGSFEDRFGKSRGISY